MRRLLLFVSQAWLPSYCCFDKDKVKHRLVKQTVEDVRSSKIAVPRAMESLHALPQYVYHTYQNCHDPRRTTAALCFRRSLAVMVVLGGPSCVRRNVTSQVRPSWFAVLDFRTGGEFPPSHTMRHDDVTGSAEDR